MCGEWSRPERALTELNGHGLNTGCADSRRIEEKSKENDTEAAICAVKPCARSEVTRAEWREVKRSHAEGERANEDRAPPITGGLGSKGTPERFLFCEGVRCDTMPDATIQPKSAGGFPAL